MEYLIGSVVGFIVCKVIFSSCPSLMDKHYEDINEHIEQLYINYQNAVEKDDYGKVHYDKALNIIDTFISKNLEIDIKSNKADYLRNYIFGKFHLYR